MAPGTPRPSRPTYQWDVAGIYAAQRWLLEQPVTLDPVLLRTRTLHFARLATESGAAPAFIAAMLRREQAEIARR